MLAQAAALALCLSVAACGQRPAPLVAPADHAALTREPALSGWFGDYRGTDLLEVALDGQPATRGSDDGARVVVTARSYSELVFRVIDSRSGASACVVSAHALDKGAVVSGGQPCFDHDGVRAIVRSGTATREGRELSVVLDAAVEAGLRDGTLRYQFHGARNR